MKYKYVFTLPKVALGVSQRADISINGTERSEDIVDNTLEVTFAVNELVSLEIYEIIAGKNTGRSIIFNRKKMPCDIAVLPVGVTVTLQEIPTNFDTPSIPTQPPAEPPVTDSTIADNGAIVPPPVEPNAE